MRLTPQQIDTVKSLSRQHFGPGTQIWLFGSRCNDTQKGGDYDFFIETAQESPDTLVEQKIALLAELQWSAPFEGEKIDLVIKRRSAADLPIHRLAREQGVQL